jgi:hypothetical protein
VSSKAVATGSARNQTAFKNILGLRSKPTTGTKQLSKINIASEGSAVTLK